MSESLEIIRSSARSSKVSRTERLQFLSVEKIIKKKYIQIIATLDGILENKFVYQGQ
jgi:hypothetical protein